LSLILCLVSAKPTATRSLILGNTTVYEHFPLSYLFPKMLEGYLTVILFPSITNLPMS
jgi:hypothetical protein